MKRRFGVLALLLLLVGGWYGYRLVWGVPLNIDHFADRSAFRVLYEFPGLMTLFGLGDNTLLDFHSDRLSDLSPEAERRRIDLLRRINLQLNTYDREALEGQQRLTLEYLDWSWGSRLSLYDFPYHFTNLAYAGPYPLNQTSGAQEIPLEVLSQHQQVVDEQSAGRFLDRLAAVPVYLVRLQEAAEYRAELGVIPPRVVLRRLIERAEWMLKQPLSDWSVYTALRDQLQALPLDNTRRDALMDKARAQLETAVVPAWLDYLEFLYSLLERAPDSVGVWVLPDGEAYYDALLAYYTTSSLDAREVHRLGLARVAEIGEEMSAGLAALGYIEGTLGDRVRALTADQSASQGGGGSGREAVLAEYRRMIGYLEEGTGPVFGDLGSAPLQVVPVPPEVEAGAPLAYYRGPTLDGNRPGRFFVNLADPAVHQPFAMLTLAAHEGIPGHHLETVAARNAEDIPMSRRFDVISAYGEGWALYAERLVSELGLHDAVSDIGRLQAEMFRAVRLVVDTGIHRFRWSRERAIDYMVEHTGESRPVAVSEIERYIAVPGQACAYMVGMLEIMAIREEARQRLGENFELREFHRAVLANGPLPLPALRREIERAL